MKYPPIIELNGETYMSTKIAADSWKIKQETIAKYCAAGKICHSVKYFGKRWYIPIDAVKPLPNDEIRRLLILTLQLKNNPSLEIDWSVFPIKNPAIDTIYRYLAFLELIETFDIVDVKRIPYEIILTRKGLEFVTSNKKEKITDYNTTLREWLPTIIGAAQLIAQVAQTIKQPA